MQVHNTAVQAVTSSIQVMIMQKKKKINLVLLIIFLNQTPTVMCVNYTGICTHLTTKMSYQNVIFNGKNLSSGTKICLILLILL